MSGAALTHVRGHCGHSSGFNCLQWKCAALARVVCGRGGGVRGYLDTSFQTAEECEDAGPGTSAAYRLIGEVVQSRRRPLLGPSPG